MPSNKDHRGYDAEALVAPRSPCVLKTNVLPTNICQENQLSLVPQECLSGETKRPLRHVDDEGTVYHYALRPMKHSIPFVLIVELLERFSFYGIYFTLTLFLTGTYDEDWNAGFDSVKAASFVSLSTMVAYSTPFVGALLADSIFGDYKSILFGCLCFYLPGLFCVAASTVPHLFGTSKFNQNLVALGTLFLWPMGTGSIKSIVNVFGAKQFHPLLQSDQIESYYVNFYMCINIGALTGIGTIPFVAQRSVATAYFVVFSLLAVSTLVFIAGTPRYVCSPPSRKKPIWSSNNNGETISLFTIFKCCLLIVPFCVVQNQMPTTFVVQGTVMTKAFGFIDVATMNSLDAISVLVFGYLTASHIYPALAKRGIKLATTHKFALGSTLGALAIVWALVVEQIIHRTYQDKGIPVCVLWQAPSYIFIGWGEIFAISAAYEMAFQIAPPDKKVLASAINIFCVGGLPSMLCIALYHSCSRWFQDKRGNANIQHIEDYSTAHVGNYFMALLFIMIFGIILNVLPWVRDFVSSVEQKTADLVKTPLLKKKKQLQSQKNAVSLPAGTDETSHLLHTPTTGKRIKQYSNQTAGFKVHPLLQRFGSMREGPIIKKTFKKKSGVKQEK